MRGEMCGPHWSESVEDLVVEDVDAVATAEFDERVVAIKAQDRAGRVVGKVDRDRERFV